MERTEPYAKGKQDFARGKKTGVVTFRMNSADIAAMDTLCDLAGVTRPRFMRSLVIDELTRRGLRPAPTDTQSAAR